MKSTAYFVALAPMIYGVFCTTTTDESCDANDCDLDNSMSAISICVASVLHNDVPQILIGPGRFDSNESVRQFCWGFCNDTSRETLGPPSHLGAAWDICSGCPSTLVDDVCSICSSRPWTDKPVGVGACRSEPTSQVCLLSQSDPAGPSATEEVIGQTTTAEECAGLVLLHRPRAGGMSWSMDDHDFNGLGRCYAEFSPTYLNDIGFAQYKSCIFASPTKIAQESFGVQNHGSGSGSGVGSGSGLDRNDGGANNGGGSEGDETGDGATDETYGTGGGPRAKHAGKKGKKGMGLKDGMEVQYRSGPDSTATIILSSCAVLAMGIAAFGYKRLRSAELDETADTGNDMISEQTPLLDSSTTLYGSHERSDNSSSPQMKSQTLLE